jgi:hypothetical protein
VKFLNLIWNFFLPGVWKKQLIQLSKAIESKYKTKSKNKVGVCRIKQVSEKEFFIFFGIIIFSGTIGKGGKLLFEKEGERQKGGCFACHLQLISALSCLQGGLKI